jgi:hypothetical protein
VNALAEEALALLGETQLGPRPAYLDTETTGLAGGAGTLAFLVGVGVWEGDGVRVHQIFLRDPAEEPAAMRYLADLLGEVTGLITFNGLGFDLPLLETRFILQRMPPRWRALPHLDLLPVARLLWRDHLPSRRLAYLETELLEVQRTHEDMPGWMIPTAYRNYLRTGVTGEIRRIFYHNEVDILSLVTLLVHAARLVHAPETSCTAATEWVGVGRLCERAGRVKQAEAAWWEALEADSLPGDVAARLWSELGLRRKRAERWAEAVGIWREWAHRQPRAVEPLVELAKYYEWQTHELAAALSETEEALRRARDRRPGRRRRQRLEELEHRRARLQRKLNV